MTLREEYLGRRLDPVPNPHEACFGLMSGVPVSGHRQRVLKAADGSDRTSKGQGALGVSARAARDPSLRSGSGGGGSGSGGLVAACSSVAYSSSAKRRQTSVSSVTAASWSWAPASALARRGLEPIRPSGKRRR